MAEPDLSLQPIPQGATRLITARGDQEALTARRETDCRTAMSRGLREYLEQLSIRTVDGREVRFKQVLESWGESEEAAEFPSAVVYAGEPADYEASDFSPATVYLPDGTARALRKVAELKVQFTVEVWAAAQADRVALVAMLEDAFDPVDEMTGFVLELPHYHGSRAVFEKLQSSYVDSPEVNRRRWRNAAFLLAGQVSQLRFLGEVPPIDVRLNFEVDGDVDAR